MDNERTETPGERKARHFREADELYNGPCPLDQYVPNPPTFYASPQGIHCKSEPLILPPKDSWHSIETHQQEIEVRYTDDQGVEQLAAIEGATAPDTGGIFVDDCPVDPLSRFSVRGRTCAGFEDSHPENRGYILSKRYNGKWSEWSEWQDFDNGVALGREPYSGPMYFWKIRMRLDHVLLDGESVQSVFSGISGEWRTAGEYMDRVTSAFALSNGKSIEGLAFHAHKSGQEYMTFFAPCDPEEHLAITFDGDSFDGDFKHWFDKVADVRFPDITSPADGEENGATLQISRGEHPAEETDEPTSNLHTDEDAQAEIAQQQEENAMDKTAQTASVKPDPVYGNESAEQIDALIARVREKEVAQAEEAEREALKAVHAEIPAILEEIEAEVEQERAPEDRAPKVEELREKLKQEIKAKVVGALDDNALVESEDEPEPVELTAEVSIIQNVPFVRGGDADDGASSYLACQTALLSYHLKRDVDPAKLQEAVNRSSESNAPPVAWVSVVRGVLQKDGLKLVHHEIVDGTSAAILTQIDMGNPVILRSGDRDGDGQNALCIGYEYHKDTGQHTMIFHDPTRDDGDGYRVDGQGGERPELSAGFEAAEIYTVERASTE